MSQGNFFEDFRLGQRFDHPLPRTMTEADIKLYIALTGSRNALMSSAPLAIAMGHAGPPLDSLLVFNIAFGKTVTDISLNAVANLGYADVRFLSPVYPGDTITACSTVIGLRETSVGDAGVVHVQSVATNQHGTEILRWIRWVLVNKRDPASPSPPATAPTHPTSVQAEDFAPSPLKGDFATFARATGSDLFWEDYDAGQRIDHASGMTVEEADHMMATRLYQNDARVHFDAHLMRNTRHGRRLVYGGHVMSLCHALACNGLENVLEILAINGGSHLRPTFAGDTLYAVTQVLGKIEMPDRRDLGALQLRLIGLRDKSPSKFVWDGDPEGLRSHSDVVLDLDYTVLVPRRITCPSIYTTESSDPHMSDALHPDQALFSGEKPTPAIASCEHFAGSEKLIAKAFALQEREGPVFDVTCDCEDGAPTGQEYEHAHMVAALIASPANRFKQAGVRIHDPSHGHWRKDVDIILSGAGEDIAYITVPKATSAGQLAEVIDYIRQGCSSRGIEGGIPIHALIETHGALADIQAIASLPWMQVLDFGLMDFVSAHNGAIPSSAMQSPGQFEHRLLARAKAEVTAAALGSGLVPSHNVCLDLKNVDRIRSDALRARNEFGFLRMWSIYPDQIRPIVEAMRPDHSEIEASAAILMAARNVDWGPIQYKGELHDRATYRYFWNILKRASVTGLDIPEEARQAFFA